MQQFQPSYVAVPHTQNKEGLWSIKLRLTFQVAKDKWVQKYYPLKLYCTKEDFATATNPKRMPRSPELLAIRKAVSQAEDKASKIMEAHERVDQELFDRVFNQDRNFKDVKSIFEGKIAALNARKKKSSESLYISVMRAIETFAPGMTFPEITTAWLEKFAAWILDHTDVNKKGTVIKRKNSKTTVSIYMRYVKAAFNIAIKKKYVSADLYPFGDEDGLYKIKKTKKRKIALTEDMKNQLLKLGATSDDQYVRFGINYWAFSYFCYGLNLTDIAKLKFSDLQDDVIIKERGKTEDSDGDNEELVIPVTKEAKAIIAKYGNKSLNPNAFVFPILTEDVKEEDVRKAVKQFCNRINGALKKAEAHLRLDKKLTTYTARHTFANIALKKGTPLTEIQHALGHSSSRQTKTYLNGMDIATKLALSSRL